MSIVIVGPGIGGLAAALSLHEAGHRDVRVFERVADLRPLGVGINLLTAAVCALTELGLMVRMAEPAAAPSTPAYFNRYGQRIWCEPRGSHAGYRWPQLSVYRGRLQRILLETVHDRLDPEAVLTGHQLVAVEHGVDADVACSDTDAGVVRGGADVVVRAGGIHSALHGSNGASQTILDARTPALHLTTAPTVEQALTRYEADRRPPTTALVHSNRRQVREHVMVPAHERAPHGFGDIGEVFAPGELADYATSCKRAAVFHPDAPNSRQSLTRRASADE
ncbi:hypothetical protein [Streptomyces sp. NPDC060035]|uniref:hypothetical protein n=1 Tax=Streptomyces sp. NPDC060035 TaxID=3347044 RepID=UPI0036CC53E4